MTLKTRITDDMKAAMRAKDAARLSAIRLLLAAIKQKEIDERIALDDAQVLATVERLLKQRRESIAQYEQAGRDDLAAKERFEADVLAAYLPAQLSDAEVDAAIAAAIAESGAAGPKDMGRVMGLLKLRLAGRADMAAVSARVKSRLAG
jgi:uncharacterized protein YqeY